MLYLGVMELRLALTSLLRRVFEAYRLISRGCSGCCCAAEGVAVAAAHGFVSAVPFDSLVVMLLILRRRVAATRSPWQRRSIALRFHCSH